MHLTRMVRAQPYRRRNYGTDKCPCIEYEEDGSVILYYKNQSIDITHKFSKDKICYVKLVDV